MAENDKNCGEGAGKSRITLRPGEDLFCDHQKIPEEAAENVKVVLPPGFRFVPTDEELASKYLKPKMEEDWYGAVSSFPTVNVYKYNPEELAEMYPHLGEKEWYFFTPRDRKYQNGHRPSRAAGDGYWKPIGADKPIITDECETVGYKKCLIFYKGQSLKGKKTKWAMQEYTVQPTSTPRRQENPNNTMLLDSCVLCKIFEKSNRVRSRTSRKKVPRKAAKNGKQALPNSSNQKEIDSVPRNAKMLPEILPAVQQNPPVPMQHNPPVLMQHNTPVLMQHNTLAPMQHNPPVPIQHNTLAPMQHNTLLPPMQHNPPAPMQHNPQVQMQHNTLVPMHHNPPVPMHHNTPVPMQHNPPAPMQHNPRAPMQQHNTRAPMQQHNTRAPMEHKPPAPMQHNPPVQHNTLAPMQHNPPGQHNPSAPMQQNPPARMQLPCTSHDVSMQCMNLPLPENLMAERYPDINELNGAGMLLPYYPLEFQIPDVNYLDREALQMIQDGEALRMIQEGEESRRIQDPEALRMIQKGEELRMIQKGEELRMIQKGEALRMKQDQEALKMTADLDINNCLPNDALMGRSIDYFQIFPQWF